MVNMPPSIPWKPEYEGLTESMKLVSAGFGHRYQVPGQLRNITSVTTRTNVENKYQLNIWRVKNSLEYMASQLTECEPGNLPGEDAYRDYLEKLVKRSVDPPQDKRDLGSLTHALLEEHYTGRLPEVDFEYDQEDLDLAQESARVAMIHIRALGVDERTISSELKIFNPKHIYAGTIDLVGYAPTKQAWLVMDWKRAKGLWPGNGYQLAAYAEAFRELVVDGTRVEAWLCLLPSEEGVAMERREVDIDYYFNVYMLAQRFHQATKDAEQEWKG